MNISKKLKLAFLATSFMFLPKEGYAVGDGNEDDKVSLSRSRPTDPAAGSSSSFLVSSALEPFELENRRKVINNNKGYLFPTSASVDERASIMESLLKFEVADIIERVELMEKLKGISDSTKLKGRKWQDWESERRSWDNSIKQEAALLSADELKSRVGKGLSILDTSPSLEPMATQLLYLSLKLKPADFGPYVNLIKENQDLLVRAIAGANASSNMFSSSFEEIKGRVIVIQSYKDLLDNAAEGILQGVGAGYFIQQDVSEIYAAAKSQYDKEYFKNYFLSDFLPRMGKKFREVNGSPLTDEAILRMMFPAHNSIQANFSPKILQPYIENAGSIYMNLFQPAPFLELPPSVSIGGSPASSSS